MEEWNFKQDGEARPAEKVTFEHGMCRLWEWREADQGQVGRGADSGLYPGLGAIGGL